MKILLILGMSVTLFAQTEVTTPLTVLAPNDDSAPSVVQVQDQAQHTIGFIAPPLVTQIVVSACTTANPTVCTLANPRPTTIQAGGTATLSGALGAGCSGLNATHAVSAVATSTITLTFNATGCTYTANSAKLTTSIYWELPAKDCGAGEVWGYSAPYVLGCVTGGSGGANIQLSNLGTTAINASLLFDTDDLYYVGSSTERAKGLYSEIDSTAELDVTDAFAVKQWQITANSNILIWTDSTSNVQMTLDAQSLGTFGVRLKTPTVVAQPTVATDNGLFIRGYQFGQTAPYIDVVPFGGSSVFSVDSTGAITSLPLAGVGTRDVCVTSAGLFTLTSCPSSGGGANIQLSNLGTTAINAHLLPASNNTIDLGTNANEFGAVYAYTAVQSQKHRVAFMTGTTLTDYFDLTAPSAAQFRILDSGSTAIVTYSNTFVPIWQFRGNVQPSAVATYSSGDPTFRWTTVYGQTADFSSLAGVGTRSICATAGGVITITGCPSGANTALSNLASVAINTALLPASANSTDVGSTTKPFAGIYGTSIFGESIKVANPSTSLGTSWTLSSSNTGVQNFFVKDTGGATRLSYTTASSGTLAVTGNLTAANSTLTGTVTTGDISITGTAGSAISTNTGSFSVTYAGYVSGLTMQGNATTTNIAFRNLLSSFTVNGNGAVVASSTAPGALTGTFNLSGDETVTGNWYARSFAGSGISCAGVANGWMAWDTAGQNLLMCAGGARYRVNLAAY